MVSVVDGYLQAFAGVCRCAGARIGGYPGLGEPAYLRSLDDALATSDYGGHSGGQQTYFGQHDQGDRGAREAIVPIGSGAVTGGRVVSKVVNAQKYDGVWVAKVEVAVRNALAGAACEHAC